MRITVKTNTYIYLVLLLFLLPIRWMISWLIAMAFHEFCHWLAVKLCGGTVYQLTVGLGGANMQCSNMTDGRRLFAVLCGPIGGLVLVALAQWFPRIALCSLLLSLYNLLPLLPLDGGRALHILLGGHRAFYVIEYIFFILLGFIAIFVTFYLRLGVLPLAVVVGLWLKNRKRPCKEGICRVQ